MKKTILTLVSVAILTLTYGQEIKKDNKHISLTSTTITTNPDNTITLSAKQIFVDNRLELEADSAQYDTDTKILTAFGTKNFGFNGKVVVNKETNIYRFYLDSPREAIAIIEE